MGGRFQLRFCWKTSVHVYGFEHGLEANAALITVGIETHRHDVTGSGDGGGFDGAAVLTNQISIRHSAVINFNPVCVAIVRIAGHGETFPERQLEHLEKRVE